MTAAPDFTLTPLPRAADGARVQFDCLECGHAETFTRLRHADIAHVLGSDHYWGECPAVRWSGERHPRIVEHATQLAAAHRATYRGDR